MRGSNPAAPIAGHLKIPAVFSSPACTGFLKNMNKPQNGVSTLHASEIANLLRPVEGEQRLVLMVGAPGSGKSTLARSIERAQTGFVRLSLDSVRQRLFGSEADQSEPERVVDAFREEFEERLLGKHSVLVDNTNVTGVHRRTWIEIAQNRGVRDIHILVMNAPLSRCLQRNRSRERVVPEDVLHDMHARLNGRDWPGGGEGRITIVRPTWHDNMYKVSGALLHLRKMQRQANRDAG